MSVTERIVQCLDLVEQETTFRPRWVSVSYDAYIHLLAELHAKVGWDIPDIVGKDLEVAGAVVYVDHALPGIAVHPLLHTAFRSQKRGGYGR